ncbi:Acetyltransferase (GNAT) domain-containing protein [Collimonas sp. OK607]|uniref:GNAT family N-acetyltransferase n=1 Tax=Collimonas sp. OK607 TaxID=1798194 RepID=UPI0008EF7283|nr:GNAT family N-acetyltransferase [Collimonas sp. OK607]SFB02268.1 Acetyltransferase (GNAT) domain-containing protein [Collimonas sp. OK607]
MSASNRPLVTLVQAVESDFEELVALRIAAMRESLERVGRFDPVRARERFRANFSASHTRHVILNGLKVGFVAVKPAQDQLLLDHLYIRPGNQGQGIGAAVLARICKEADDQSMPLRVGALRGSDSNRFYQRNGFEFLAEEEWDIYYLRPAR